MLGLGTLGVIGISVRTKGVGSKGHYENSFIRGPIFTKPFEGSRKTKNELLKMSWAVSMWAWKQNLLCQICEFAPS